MRVLCNKCKFNFDIAIKTGDIAKLSNDVISLSNEPKESTDRLVEMVSKFKI